MTDVFGAVRTHTGTSTNEFTFTGEQHDLTGLEYLRARYYDASTGRFLSQDPMPLLQRYAYGNNNPANLVDPSGMFPSAYDVYAVAKQILADPCWKTHAFCKHAALVWKTSANVARLLRNAPVTEAFVGVGLLAGGSCAIDGDLFISCSGANWGYMRGGTTYGNVFITGKSRQELRDQPDLLTHERRHATQWAMFGPVMFPIGYGVAELAGGGACGNVFERQAGLREGHYYGC